jgi:ribA/ribD-fused uncharacterized protein
MDGDVLDGPFSQVDEFVLAFVTSDVPFTNWSAHQISIWGMRFATVEHAYQYKKFIEVDPELALKIKNATSPWRAKKLGWSRPIITAEWDSKRERVIWDLLTAKVRQHEDVRTALRATGNRAIIVKGNERDEFWGIGTNNNGLNTLGKIWMSLRQQL